MLRTFRRSRLPIWYTEGFNPHPYYSFALALSLGFESSCEILDFNLNEDIPFDEIRDKLNAVMPEGMRIVKVAEQKQKITAITEAEYSFSFYIELLLIGDGLERMIAKYPYKGRLFIMRNEETVCAACVVTDEGTVLLNLRILLYTRNFSVKDLEKVLLRILRINSAADSVE